MRAHRTPLRIALVSVLVATGLVGTRPAQAAPVPPDPASAHQSGERIASEAAASSTGQQGSRSKRSRGQVGGFVSEIMKTIRGQSAELCARYGASDDCLDEAEVCVAIRDADDNRVRLCLTTEPSDNGDHEGSGKVKANARRSRLAR